jgi:hypothetical protein
VNKRLIKKVHKKYLNDICYDISLSSFWRKKLFDGKDKEKFLIDLHIINELPKYIKTPVLRYRLRYYVYKTDEILDMDFYYEGGVFFKFEAVGFNKISNYSFNNLGVI